jgi:hypothetical protein
MTTRVYADIFADFASGSVSDSDWQELFAATKEQPLCASILGAARAAQEYITHRKRSQNANHLRLHTMLGFEINDNERDALLIVLDNEAAYHSVSGNTKAKFEGVLQAELRAAATGLGYPQADKLHVTLINQDIANTFRRDVAIEQGQQYIRDNDAVWHEAEI